ncbi:MAG: ABC transporter substrate-binding protein [Bdellovibrionota bacterium]
MKRSILLLSVVTFAFCGGKASVQDGKKANKKDKAVISAFETDVKSPQTTTPAPEASNVEAPSAPVIPAAPVDKNSPKEVIKNYTGQLQTLKDDTKLQGKNRDRQISDKVRNFFDFEGLSRQSLGSNWSQLTPRKQQEFVTLFTSLIERSYLSRSKNLVGNYEVSYGDEKVTGETARVGCKIYKEDVDVEIVYELHKVGSKWMIYNIIFDQVNLVRNYQSQFNQIIAKNKVDGLLDIMRKKVKESPSDTNVNI